MIDMKIINPIETNSLALAYLGDSVYDLYIRNHLINNGIVKVNDLQKESIKYVSAKSQCGYIIKMLENNFFSESEKEIINRARNHKSHTSPKGTSIVTYKYSTALEALIGYLYIDKNYTRINQIMDEIVKG